MNIDVVIPSYRRPMELHRCLSAVSAIDGPPRGMLAVLRQDDRASRAVAAGLPGVTIVDVCEPGHLPPLVAALAASSADVVAVLDDDAVPRASWLKAVASAFERPQVVALTGPVFEHSDGPKRPPPDLEELERSRGRTWYKAFQSVHWTDQRSSPLVPHRRFAIEVLAGGNMALRRVQALAVGFDPVLNRGAAINYEGDLALGLTRYGEALFDTDFAVDHYPAARSDTPSRKDRLTYLRDYTSSLYYIVAKRLGLSELLLFLPVMLAVGQSVSPGILRWRRVALDLGLPVRRVAHAVTSAGWHGFVTGMRTRQGLGAVDTMDVHVNQRGSRA